jgi:formylglycine-generating enzyme required for sulfatase activity
MNQSSNLSHLEQYLANLKSIPSGTFRWGSSPAGNESGTVITMSQFSMGATPVTWGIWKEYCEHESVTLPDDSGWGYRDDHPVINVSWEDIMKPGGFCAWASNAAGFKLTLPTDAQFEYAARGGSDGLEYPWGNEFDRLLLWCSVEFGDVDRTAAVDRTDRIYRNGYGLTDMVGNVGEWCADYGNQNYRPSGQDPVDTKNSKFRSVRGSSWDFNNPASFRCAYRKGYFSDYSLNNGFGFRLAVGPS